MLLRTFFSFHKSLDVSIWAVGSSIHIIACHPRRLLPAYPLFVIFSFIVILDLCQFLVDTQQT